MNREEAIKILMRELLLDKGKDYYESFPEVKEAAITAVQSLRAWDDFKQDIERHRTGKSFTPKNEFDEGWNKGFADAMMVVSNLTISRYIERIEKPLYKVQSTEDTDE